MTLTGALGMAFNPGHTTSFVRAAARTLVALHFDGDQIFRHGHSTSRATAVGVGWLLAPAQRAAFRASFLAHWDRFISEIVSRMSG